MKTMEFVGVTTGASSIVKMFPLWARDLGLEAQLVGRDVALDAPPGAYRAIVEDIRADDDRLGALVTTHKLALLDAARDLFDELDPHAERLGEVSSISKRDGRVVGHAFDPITSGRAIAHFLGEDHFARTGGHALCLGAGGAGAAIVVNLLERPDAPERVVVTDTRPERLEAVAALGAHETAPPERAGELLAASPPGSLVVNATGMGKDRPGSPLPGDARFPEGVIAWELNYRGDLDFLHQVRAAGARAEDGWLYFLYGWTAVMAEVFGFELTEDRFARLKATADGSR